MPSTHLNDLLRQDDFRRTFTEVLLPTYLPQQRWFTSKGKHIEACELESYYPLLDDAGLAVLAIDFSDGDRERYQLPLTLSREPAVRQHYRDHYPKHILGEITDTGMLADAVARDNFRGALYELMAGRREAGHLSSEAGRALREAGPSQTSQLPPIDTSNTAITYDGRLFLKLFRKLEAGLNPDLELVRYLSESAGFEYCPRYAGSLGVGNIENRAGYLNLGMMTGRVDNRGDAWEYFQALTERFFAGDGGVGRETLDRARLLGRRTAELHRALAAAGPERPDLVPESMTADYRTEITSAARRLLERQLRELADCRGELRGEQAELADRVLQARAKLDRQLSTLAEREVGGRLTRIHGDYHLGQVLVTDDDYVIIDFEGEPLLSIPARRRKRPPLKDVAGMLRSFHYAAHAQLLLHPDRYAAGADLQERAEAWYERVGGAYLDAYLETNEGTDFLPDLTDDRRALLDLFILEKAVYEVAYELNSRPDWLAIPLRGVLQVLDKREGV